MSGTALKTFIASFLGWTLDAFDFFLVLVVLSHLATDFHKTIPEVAFAVTLTLAFRPLGALIFGWFADRYGRRVPLMVDIALFSLIELATAFSPNFTVFIVLRALFGIAMGGEWGLGAALAMEALPPKNRGLFSGLLQSGYATGNLLAGAAFGLLFTHIGWRGMFVVGALPALLIIYIRSHVPESEVWKAKAHERLAVGADVLLASIKRSWPLYLYGLVFMTALNAMSHGAQDPYATFLTKQHGFDPAVVGVINGVGAIGAIIGGIFFGTASQRIGRRYAIVICAVGALLAIPLFAFSHTMLTLALGGFIMQFAVQGAWGVIPAHLNEIAPSLARATFPAFVYQIGNLLSAWTLQIITTIAAVQYMTPSGPDYGRAMATFLAVVLVSLIVVTLLGFLVRPERREESFLAVEN